MDFITTFASNIDTMIVLIYLVINLAVGYYYGRGINSVKQYAIGDRNFSTATLVSTIVATWIGGGFFALLISRSYSDGLAYIVPKTIDYAITFFIIGYYIAPRMKEFLGAISIAEAMGKLYGTKIRVITAISGFFAISGLIAVQFKVAALLLSNFFDMNLISALLIISSVIISYSAFGGIKSVVFTDVLQFFTFGTIIPLLGIMIWKDVEHMDHIIDILLNHKNFGGMECSFNNPSFVSMLQLSLIFLIPALHPSLFQRISMSADTAQVKRSFIFSCIISVCLVLITCWIGVLMLTVNPDLKPDTVWIYIINNYTFAGFKGVVIVAIISMVMSTADSYINSSSILISNDILKVLKPVSDKKQLIITKISALVIGIISIILSITDLGLLELVLLANNFYMPIVTVPLLLAIFGFRSSTKSVLIGMSAGLIAVVIWRMYFMQVTSVDSILPGMLSNLIFLLGSHYLLNQDGGWHKQYSPQVTEKINYVSKYTKFNYTGWLARNLPNNDITYVVFGIFCIISVFSSVYSLGYEVKTQYIAIVEIMAFSELLIATYFLIYPIWRCKNIKIIAVIWTIALWYSLTFKTVLELLISHFSYYQSIIFLASTIVFSIILRWQAAIPLMFCGIISAFAIFKFGLENDVNINFSNDMYFKLIYSLILIISLVIAFLKPKQEHLEETEAKVEDLVSEVIELDHEVSGYRQQVSHLSEKVSHYSERVEDQAKEIERLGATAQKILNNVNHELRLPVGNVMNFAQMLGSGIDKMSAEEVKMISEEVYTNSTRLSTMILNMLDLAMLSAKKIELKKRTINFSELVEERVKTCRAIYLGNKKIDFRLTIEPEILIAVDPNYIRQVVDNIVINSINFSDEGLIEVNVTREDEFVKLTISDNGKGIPMAELYDIFTPFKMGSNSQSKAQGRGVGLALCKAAIKAHGGSIKAESNGNQGVKFTVLLPSYRMSLEFKR